VHLSVFGVRVCALGSSETSRTYSLTTNHTPLSLPLSSLAILHPSIDDHGYRSGGWRRKSSYGGGSAPISSAAAVRCVCNYVIPETLNLDDVMFFVWSSFHLRVDPFAGTRITLESGRDLLISILVLTDPRPMKICERRL
jgi:hypothetical protein